LPVTGIDVYLLITIMGVICIIYTVMGGIEAVIWADVIQVVILLGVRCSVSLWPYKVRNTFYALKELVIINNSIQPNAGEIDIKVNYTARPYSPTDTPHGNWMGQATNNIYARYNKHK
jgi:Na+/proline symporter